MFNQKDIRSCRFEEAILAGANFQEARSGQKPLQKFLLASFSLVASSIFSIIAVLSGGILEGVVEYALKDAYPLIFVLLCFAIYAATLILLVVRGFEFSSITVITSIVIISGIGYIISGRTSGIWADALFLGFSAVFTWFGVGVTAFSLIISSKCCGILGKFIAFLISATTVTVAPIIAVNSQAKSPTIETTITTALALIIIITGAIITQEADRGSPSFSWLGEIAVLFAAIGGTSFYKADLSDACFDDADLSHTDFRKAILTRTSFKNVSGLELSLLKGTILEDTKVRKLLITKRGCNDDYTGANLNGANLRGADLTRAILTEVRALDADFSGAVLTDACIQDWNINKNTCFKDVICQRVYLKCSRKGNRIILSEPKPDSGEFQPGEFEKWITDVRDTIDLIFQNGLNWRAFAFSLTQTAINHDGLGLSVRSIENKGDGVIVAKVGVSLETNKTALHQEITNHYNKAVTAIEAKYQLVLKAKEGEIERLKSFHDSQQKFIQGLITGIAETKGKVLIQGEGNRVYMMNQAGDIMESKNQNISAGANVDMSSGAKVTVGRDVTGSSITLGDLTGQVSNTIQQLKDVSTDSSDELAEILTTLQKSITTDSALSESQKKEALEAVETIAEEGKKPSGDRVLKLCSMAMNALKGISTTVTDASILAQTCKAYLPTLAGLLGL